ncbi:DNA replication protein [Paenibacillus polymyxa]|uniref:DNA replication protein n=1 Tax=Paenibacillus TaxID=44249 RepID=UPI00142E18D8|nr:MULTISPECIES: DNA replication protein [Paenibacillus]KAF6658918.1 DNA replication protein [Paenibacillus sp. EKM301P]UBS85453.1 DNA replication protein [Paenibacillus polymyxa]WHX33971.1 DNA replication protein [Paenibacillus polymyxa]
MSNADKCILSPHCSQAGGPSCNNLCSSLIAVHGFNGAGGRIAVADVPKEYTGVTLQNSPAREGQAEAYKVMDAYVNTFKRQFDNEEERIKSLYLYSESPGTGKTTSASAILHEYIVRHYIGSLQRDRQPLERPAYFLDVNAWQTLFLGFNRCHVPAETAERYAAEYYAMESRAKVTPFVVLDDIGVRSATDAFRADLHSIVNYRVANGLPTVYTSNVAIGDLTQVFDARLADRVRDMCAVIPFIGSSKRGIRK